SVACAVNRALNKACETTTSASSPESDERHARGAQRDPVGCPIGPDRGALSVTRARSKIGPKARNARNEGTAAPACLGEPEAPRSLTSLSSSATRSRTLMARRRLPQRRASAEPPPDLGRAAAAG